MSSIKRDSTNRDPGSTEEISNGYTVNLSRPQGRPPATGPAPARWSLAAARGPPVRRWARRALGLVKPGARMPGRVITPAGFFERLARAGLRAGTGFAAMVDIW